MTENQKKFETAKRLYEGLLDRVSVSIPPTEIKNFVMMFLASIEEMEKIKNELQK